MSMLAEPRQRKTYNLVPRGKALYEDDCRFGTKMLMKMGWSKDKGLGAKEDGSTEFVRVHYKNNVEGLGYEMRDDQWTQHERSFNGLLENLSGKAKESNEKDVPSDEEIPRVGFGFAEQRKKTCEKLTEKISGESLEEKSKRSKARVHYKKFTRGKDLSRYSEKDLANIFGKKAVEDGNTVYEQFSAVTVPQTDSEDDKKEENDKFAGVQTIHTGVSVGDYFKLKMEAIRNKQHKNQQLESVEPQLSDVRKEESKKRAHSPQVDEEIVPKKKKNKNKDNCVEDQANSPMPIESYEGETRSNDKKSKKAAKKPKCESMLEKEDLKPDRNTERENDKELKDKTHSLEVSGKQESKKKKKKSKEDDCVEDLHNPPLSIELHEGVNLSSESFPSDKMKSKKATKKSKCKGILEKEDSSPNGNNENTENKNGQEFKDEVRSLEVADKQVPKKKKKSKEDNCIEDQHKPSFPIELHEGTNQSSESSPNDKKKSKKAAKQSKYENMLKTQESSDLENHEEIYLESTNTTKDVEHFSKNSLKSSDVETNEQADNMPIVTIIEKLSKKTLDLSQMTLNELCVHMKDFDVLSISTFDAERFRNCQLDNFNGANIASITGYACSNNLELKIKNKIGDEARILELWSGKINKYADQMPKYTYHKYVKEIRNARRLKAKIPHLHVKTWKRKQVFQAI